MMGPLYFPEDKTEYIPSIIMIVITIIAVFVVMRTIIRVSNREKERVEREFPDAKIHTESKNSTKNNN